MKSLLCTTQPAHLTLEVTTPDGQQRQCFALRAFLSQAVKGAGPLLTLKLAYANLAHGQPSQAPLSAFALQKESSL